MCQRSSATSVRHLVLAVALAVGLGVMRSAGAADAATEREDLALMLRELDLIDHLALEAQAVAPQEDRYHFDYGRLEADLARVRGGINDYLAPPRAQPRDPMTLSADYRREGRSP